jgi:hypothetical protein
MKLLDDTERDRILHLFPEKKIPDSIRDFLSDLKKGVDDLKEKLENNKKKMDGAKTDKEKMEAVRESLANLKSINDFYMHKI